MATRPARIHWPAVLTAVRVVLVAPVVIFTLRETEASAWIAWFAFGVAALTDGLDGYVARRMELVSDVGKLWDPLADKVLVTASMIALVIVERFPVWAAVVIVAREVAVAGLRWIASARGNSFPASVAGKLKTGAQLIAVLFFIVPAGGAMEWIEDVSLWFAVVLTVGSGIDYFVRAPSLLRGARPV